MNSAPTTGVYVSAEELAEAPDYARRLVEEHGVGLFVIRTGFDPARTSPRLDEAVGAVTRLGVSFQFLVGTWWGAGLTPAGPPMAPVVRLLDYGADLAHEAQWEMAAPGGEGDRAVQETIDRLCGRYHPAGICLTHARFKHPADINSLFSTAGGRFGDAMAAAGFTRAHLTALLGTMSQRLRGLSPATVRATTLIEFLDELTATDSFSRWFDFRCRQVAAAVAEIFAPIRRRHPGVQLGTNAMGPMFSRCCGQDYGLLATSCDFLQPLLGYMRWHVLQPIYAWAALLHKMSGTLKPGEALALSARLFGFGPAELALDWNQRGGTDEGDESAMITMVRRQLGALVGAHTAIIAPVLRGHGVAPGTNEVLVDLLRQRGCSTILFQGGDHQSWVLPPARSARTDRS